MVVVLPAPSEQSVDASLRNAQRQVVHRGMLGEPLGDVDDVDRVLGQSDGRRAVSGGRGSGRV